MRSLTSELCGIRMNAEAVVISLPGQFAEDSGIWMIRLWFQAYSRKEIITTALHAKILDLAAMRSPLSFF